MHTNIKHVQISQLQFVMQQIQQAKQRMHHANIPQWTDDYPNELVMMDDIENQRLIGCYESGSDELLGFAALYFQPDPNYSEIFNGNWLTNIDNYATIHRIVVSSQNVGKGIGNRLMQGVIDIAVKHDITSVRADTHKINMPMQHLLNKFEFMPCGTVYMEDGSPRIGYERLL